MTLSALWPPLIVAVLGLLIVGTAAVLHLKSRDTESDGLGCLVIILGVIGVILIWKSTDAITHLMEVSK